MAATPQQLRDAVNKAMKSSVLTMASDPSLVVNYLPTGVLPIDHLLEGGIPRGRFTEFFGDYSTLKSYVGYCCIAATQEAGGTCSLIDTEHAFDPTWATTLGVNIDDLILQRPETGEEAVDATEGLIRSNIDLVVWDSVAATQPRSERDKSAQENVQPARLAALMSQAMRKLTAANSKTALLCINQTRVNVGIMFGNPESVPGGKALPFYSSYRVALRKGGKLTEQDKVWDGEVLKTVKTTTGIKIKATLEKSKLNAPFRESWFTFDLASGEVDEVAWLIGKGIEQGVVVRDGKNKWKMKGGKTSIVGMPKFREWLEGHESAYDKLYDAVLGETDG